MSPTRRIRRTPLALLLWAGALLFGQTAALAHQHLDDAPGTTCVVCTFAQAETAACDAAQVVVPPARSLRTTFAPDGGRFEAAPVRHFQSRAPPRG
ncbi:MAG TPA: hypothetical protein VF210_14985 [Pseudomonadales bacterium]